MMAKHGNELVFKCITTWWWKRLNGACERHGTTQKGLAPFRQCPRVWTPSPRASISSASQLSTATDLNALNPSPTVTMAQTKDLRRADLSMTPSTLPRRPRGDAQDESSRAKANARNSHPLPGARSQAGCAGHVLLAVFYSAHGCYVHEE